MELSYPAKPYIVTQAFGLYNPAYLQFGFDHHNGIDFRVDTDGIVVSMCEGEVYARGYNDGAGNYVMYKTKDGKVGFMVMHAKEILVKTGDKVMCGTPLMVADNTGFSTGPHTHISAYYIDINNKKLPIGDKNCDYCFDFSKYYNGYYADDVKGWWEKLSTAVVLLKKLLGIIK